MRRAIALSLIVAGLSGCASTTFQRDPGTPSSMRTSLGAYNLPGSSMQVEVYYAVAPDGASDGFIVAAQPPRIVSAEEVPLSTRFSAGSADKISVDRDPATGFLVKASLNLEDKTADTFKAAAASIGAILSLNPSFLVPKAALAGLTSKGAEDAAEIKVQPTLIATVKFDPTDRDQVSSANISLWRQVIANMTYKSGADCRSDAKRAQDRLLRSKQDKANGKKPDVAPPTPVPSACHGSEAIGFISQPLPASDPNGLPPDRATLLAQSNPFIFVPEAKSVSPGYIPCAGTKFEARGLCVRVAAEVSVGLQAPAGPIAWQGARLPMRGHEYVIDVERALFVTKTFTVDFTGGFPGKAEVSQTSQALAIASLPKDVIDSFIDSLGKTTGALGQLIPLRIDYAKAHAGIVDAPAAATTTTTTTAAAATTTTDATSAAAATPAATTTTTGTSGLTLAAGTSSPPATITIAPAAKPSDGNGSDPKDDGLPKPKLWFSACTLVLGCQGAVQDQLSVASSDGSQTKQLNQPQVAPGGDAPGAGGTGGGAGGSGLGAGGAGAPPATGGDAGHDDTTALDCMKTENQGKPQCKGK